MEINNNSNDKDSMPIYPSILINDENAMQIMRMKIY